MKLTTLVSFLLAFSASAFCQRTDTVVIDAKKLNINALLMGNHTYIVYTKKSKTSPSQRLTLVKININQIQHNNKPVISISQQWDSDTVVHSALTLCSTVDFSTLYHKTYWKRLGYTMTFDFENDRVDFDRFVADSIRNKVSQELTQSIRTYNLNWHSDLVIFSLLPYRDNVTFLINYYDPGFGPAQVERYSVTGSDELISNTGKKVPCWVLRYQPKGMDGYQQFWIDKETKQVLKEEDSFKGIYRYKLKVGVSEG